MYDEKVECYVLSVTFVFVCGETLNRHFVCWCTVCMCLCAHLDLAVPPLLVRIAVASCGFRIRARGL